MDALMNLSQIIGAMSVTAIIIFYAVLMMALTGAAMIQKKVKFVKIISIILSAIMIMVTAALIFAPTNTVLFIIGGVYLTLAVLDTQVIKMKI